MNLIDTALPKPQITAVEVDRESQSAFYATFDTVSSARLTPKFVDYETSISVSSLNDIEFSYVQNENNQIFELYYLFDIGSNTDKELALAIQYLPI